ncbi:MAG: hypothetical protein ABI759_06395 [Candidatus Solibacter sp.]
MSRVVLSGHSGGVSVYSKEKKGEIEFGILASLSGVFPNAAAQTKHLVVAAYFAGTEDTLLRYYQKAFPNLKTFAGWTWFSPTDAEGAMAVTASAHTTVVDPDNLRCAVSMAIVCCPFGSRYFFFGAGCHNSILLPSGS